MVDEVGAAKDYARRVGTLIRDSRKNRGWTQSQLAETLGTSQSAINRIEQGNQNLSLDLLTRISEALDSEIVSLGRSGPLHLRVEGGRKLSGSIDVKTSKNAGVGLLCASLLNEGRTMLRKVARIEEVHRILEVLNSIGVQDPLAQRRQRPRDRAAGRAGPGRARPGRGPPDPQHHHVPGPADAPREALRAALRRRLRAGHPHRRAAHDRAAAVRRAGRGDRPAPTSVEVDPSVRPAKPIVLTERGDTVTENALMAAARNDGVTVIRNASSNYMVQDLCFFLLELGVRVEGIGTTTLTVHGVPEIRRDVDYSPSEDPIEAMSLVTAAIVTGSEITVCRVPIEFMEIELALLEEMGLSFDQTPEYPAANGRTRLVDVTVHPSKLHAPLDKIHPMPFPGLNIDNLPFFALIAATAEGSTLIHDWVYDNRALYLTELTKLGAKVTLMDPHRIYVEGPTHWSGTEVICPPALRPAVVVLLAMLAAKGTSLLRNVYVIDRGYEQLADRLNLLGASIHTFRDV